MRVDGTIIEKEVTVIRIEVMHKKIDKLEYNDVEGVRREVEDMDPWEDKMEDIIELQEDRDSLEEDMEEEEKDPLEDKENIEDIREEDKDILKDSL